MHVHWEVQTGTGVGGTQQKGQRRDTRWLAASGQSSLVTQIGSGGGSGTPQNSWRLASNEAQRLTYVLFPGTHLLAIGQTVNTALTVSIAWKERHGLPGEMFQR